MPKCIHLQFNNTFVRSILAILDYNNNIKKKTLIVKKSCIFKTTKAIYNKNSYNKIQNICKSDRSKIIEKAEKEILLLQFGVQIECNTNILKNIFGTPRPPNAELKSEKYSKFT